jgi:homoprotocatechuate degradation regulator HpaR
MPQRPPARPPSPLTRPRHRNVPLAMLRAREAVIGHFRPLLNRAGVTEQQWRVLRALADGGPLEPRRICEACAILAPSLTGVLARMEETGLVTRERVATDQRRMLVALTPRSCALLHDLAPYVEAQYRSVERALGRELYDDLLRVLDAVTERLATPAPLVPLPPAPPPARRARKPR